MSLVVSATHECSFPYGNFFLGQSKAPVYQEHPQGIRKLIFTCLARAKAALYSVLGKSAKDWEGRASSAAALRSGCVRQHGITPGCQGHVSGRSQAVRRGLAACRAAGTGGHCAEPRQQQALGSSGSGNPQPFSGYSRSSWVTFR